MTCASFDDATPGPASGTGEASAARRDGLAASAAACVRQAQAFEQAHRWEEAQRAWQDAAVLAPEAPVVQRGTLRAARVLAALRTLAPDLAPALAPASEPELAPAPALASVPALAPAPGPAPSSDQFFSPPPAPVLDGPPSGADEPVSPPADVAASAGPGEAATDEAATAEAAADEGRPASSAPMPGEVGSVGVAWPASDPDSSLSAPRRPARPPTTSPTLPAAEDLEDDPEPSSPVCYDGLGLPGWAGAPFITFVGTLPSGAPAEPSPHAASAAPSSSAPPTAAPPSPEAAPGAADASPDGPPPVPPDLARFFEATPDASPRAAPAPADPGFDLDRLIGQLSGAGRIVPRDDLDAIAAPDLSSDDADEMVSETLARIYAGQKQYAQAARTYERLAETQPEHAARFRAEAARLRALA